VVLGINYGSCDGHDTGAFAHILPTTDATTAHDNFVRVRQNLKAEKDTSKESTGSRLRKLGISIAVSAIILAGLVGVLTLVKRRRSRAYRNLNAPAPDGEPGMRSVEGYNAGMQYPDTRYNAGSQYADPWTQ